MSSVPARVRAGRRELAERDPVRGKLARRRLPRLAPRKVEYRWVIEQTAPHEVVERLAGVAERRVDRDFRMAPLDPKGPGKLERPMGFLAHVDPELGQVRLGMRAGDGRKVFAPVLELEVRGDGDDSAIRGTIKREYPDSIIGLLGVAMLSMAFGTAIGMVLLFAGMFLAGGVAMAVGWGLFFSAYVLSGVALRTVNTRLVHEALINRAQEALAAQERSGYRE